SLHPIFGWADCTLTVSGGFEGYLRGLGKSRRERVKSEMKHFREAGLRFEMRRLGAIADDAAPLMVASDKKWGIELEVKWLREALHRVAARIDARTRVVCSFDGDRLVSWVLFFAHQGAWYCRARGSDESAVPRRAALYFNDMFYEPVR